MTPPPKRLSTTGIWAGFLLGFGACTATWALYSATGPGSPDPAIQAMFAAAFIALGLINLVITATLPAPQGGEQA